MKNKLMYRIGHSNDTHKLVKGRKLVLGGVNIDYELGLDGHSDADVVLHALCESIIGALGKGDLGEMFSDKDPKYKGMDSKYFVSEVYKLMDSCGYMINNVDIIIYLEKPNLVKYKPLMRQVISELLHTDIENVNVKATRREGLGFIGNMEGISAESVVMLVLKPLMKL